MGTTVLRPGSNAAIRAVRGLHRSANLRYEYGVDLVDINGNKLDTVASLSGDTPPKVSRDCAANAPTTLSFATTEALNWGSDLISPWQVIHSREYHDDEHFRFPLGIYVASSPDKALSDGVYDVTGYDKMSLLQSDIGDTFSVRLGDNYSHRIAALLDRAGIPNAQLGDGSVNPAVVTTLSDWPLAWTDKVLADDGDHRPMIFPANSGTAYQYIDIINAIFAAIGMRKLMTDAFGRFAATRAWHPRFQGTRWDFIRTDVPDVTADPFTDGQIVHASARYENDLWNLPNRYVFIQNGLTFDPIEGSGQFTIDNVSSDPDHYRPPSDQDSIGRVIRSVQVLDASDQDDLEHQAEAFYFDTYKGAERIVLSTGPWPATWHFNVARYLDATLPRTPARKVQVQSWELPLNGDDMTWTLFSVMDLLGG